MAGRDRGDPVMQPKAGLEEEESRKREGSCRAEAQTGSPLRARLSQRWGDLSVFMGRGEGFKEKKKKKTGKG